jgi:drug/metabolite transporter (DMT)-like permease
VSSRHRGEGAPAKANCLGGGRGVAQPAPLPMALSSSAEHTRALLLLLVANFFWGLSFPLIKSIVLLHEKLVPGTGGTWFSSVYTVAPRFALAVLLMLLLRPRDIWRATPREWKQGVILGLFSAAGMLLQNDGLQYTAASTSAFLTQFYAILIPVWVAVRGRSNPGARVWVCCALVLAGVAILGRFDWQELRLGRGEVETLLASLFFMGQILTLERRDFSGNRSMQITFVMFVTQAVILWILAGVMAPGADALIAPWTSPAWLGFTLTLTLLCTYGSYTLMNAWQPKITATEAGLIYCIEPIFGTLMALFLPALFSVWAAIHYPNESFTWALLVGGGLITAANVLLQVRPPAKA